MWRCLIGFNWYNESGVCYLMERFGSDFKKVNLDNVLGPITQSNILKNKSFLLTCTIPIKATTNGSNERQVCIRHFTFVQDGSEHFITFEYSL